MHIKHLKAYQSFPSVARLDEQVRGFLRQYKWELSEGNLEILTYIWRHSVKYPGVSFAKVSTIVASTGRSRSTVIRTINRFEKMNLLKRIETTRPNGKRGVNLLIFQNGTDFSTHRDDTLPDTLGDTVGEEPGPNAPNGSEPNLREETEKKQGEKPFLKSEKIEGKAGGEFRMDYSFLPSYIPETFIQAAKPFYSPVEVDGVWVCIHRAYKKAGMHQTIEAYIEQITRTFKQAVFAYKQGKVKSTFRGYLYTCVLEACRQEKRKETIRGGDSVYYDWLEEA
ncbi:MULTISPECIES: hypothetical protein [Pontibacillus]|uniref:Helix-turn-helix domain-containing protein n=1 Tax=Pontibacillus chungwhensis TaxID=265426 RepID=A0ABY8V0H5_9BACI|nr:MULTISPECIES: hypothetical protein [Pontibacillus]MCD5324463.1 hypothetical protein [Pontibacillus sp. HN14]WIF99244.1 hypothetical protein QNI29_06170 [Pontibacillus chungwhensis]